VSIKLLLIAAFLNGLLWSILIPIWQYPDEQAHFSQVQYISEFGIKTNTAARNNTSREVAVLENILGTNRDSSGNNKYTYNPSYNYAYSETNNGYFEDFVKNLDFAERVTLVKQEATTNPPLYYVGAAAIYKTVYLLDIFYRIYAVRFFSLLIFLATLYVAFLISKEVFQDRNTGNVYVALIAFMPMLVFASTGILPDTLTNFLFTLSLLILLKIISSGIDMSKGMLLAAVLALGFITRQQFIIIMPCVLLAIYWSLNKKIIHISKFGILMCALALMYYLINNIGTTVPIIAEFRIPDASIFSIKSISLDTLSSYTNIAFSTYYHQTFAWYWGVYRWLSLTLPASFYVFIKIILSISLLGLLVESVAIVRQKKINILNQKIIYLSICAIIYFMVFIVGDFLFFSKNGYSFGIQGRYFFPMVSIHVILLLKGLKEISSRFTKRYRDLFIFVILIMQITFNNLSLYYVATSYYSSQSLNTFIVQASQYKPDVLKGNTILLLIALAIFFQILYLVRTYSVIRESNESI